MKILRNLITSSSHTSKHLVNLYFRCHDLCSLSKLHVLSRILAEYLNSVDFRRACNHKTHGLEGCDPELDFFLQSLVK